MQEIDRIKALPVVPEPPLALADKLTLSLRLHDDAPPLRTVQAKTLWHAHDVGGFMADLPMGSGKSLISYLIPHVCKLERPLLLIPAHLREKTLRERKVWGKHYPIDPCFIESYSKLSIDKDKDGVSRMLDRLNPDGIILDEAHKLMNLKAGATRKFLRYLRDNPHCKVYAMSGTFFKSSLLDVHHLFVTTLKENAPIPLKRSVCAQWAAAVDPGIPLDERVNAAYPAGIYELPHKVGTDPRAIVGDRMRSTMGYLGGDAPYDGPLIIQELYADVSPICQELIEQVRQGSKPSGEPIDNPLERWAMVQELACGYWSTWDPAPPKGWLTARYNWHSFAQWAKESYSHYDTMQAVMHAVKSGKLKGGAAYLKAWLDIRGSFTPNSVPVWVDKHAPAIKVAADYLNEAPGRLCWTKYQAVAKQIGKLAKVPVYGAGQGEGGRPMVEDAEGKSVVVTIAANATGRDLPQWHDNLVMQVPSHSRDHDQLIARTHRPGQTKPVIVNYLMTVVESRKALDHARANAVFVDGMTVALPKLLLNEKGD